MATTELGSLPSARDVGWICAVSGQVQRDLHRCAGRYPGLYPSELYDCALFSSVALATTFSSPWLSAAQLRPGGRAALWTFGLDRLVDAAGASVAQVGEIVTGCLEAAGSGRAAPGDELAAFLVEIREELAATPGFPALGRVWLRELGRMLTGMARERAWLAGGPAGRPSVAAYLDNADNLAMAFVFASHLVGVHGPGEPIAVDGLFAAVRTAQRALRLVNDLATYERDAETGDLNVLMLGLSRAEAGQRIVELTATARALLAPLATVVPRLAAHVDRQLSYNLAFYGVSDYWRG